MALYVGLRTIAKRIGVSVWMVQRMADKLGLPLMMHPKSKLRGKRIVWCLDEEMFQRWILATSRLDVQAYRTSLAERHHKLVDRHVPWTAPELTAPTAPTGTSNKPPAKAPPT